MANNALTPRSQWSSSFSYILVTIGAIVGLANIIQFPYLISEYGGLFFLFYIIFELTVSLPLLLAELSIGRRGKQNPVGSIDILCLESGVSRNWRYIGWFCFLVAFLTLSYYTVQAAFPVGYFLSSLSNTSLITNTDAMTSFIPIEICFLLFLFTTMLVVARGINRGLEKISCILVPLYIIILLVLAVYMGLQGHFLDSVKALFTAHSDKTIFTIMIAAMGYAFFTLSVGMGSMIVYGSYLPYSASFRRSTICIVLVDMCVALLAYFIVIPLMLKSQSLGFQLNNHNIMSIFNGIDHHFIIAGLFFLAAIIAGWVSTIAMAETTVVTLVERFGITRLRATFIIFIAAALVGSFAAMTHTDWMSIMLNEALPLKGILMNVTGKILIPISAMCIVFFVGWVIKKNIMESELKFPPALYQIWLFLVKYVAFILIFVLLIVTIFHVSF